MKKEHESRNIFLGREKQLGALHAFAEKWLQPDIDLSQVALIWGQGGIGKTTLLREFRKEMENDEQHQIDFMHIDWQSERARPDSPFRTVKENVSHEDVFSTIKHHAEKIGRCRTYERTSKEIEKTVQQMHKALRAHESPDRAGKNDSGGSVAEPLAKATGAIVATGSGVNPIGRAAESIAGSSRGRATK